MTITSTILKAIVFCTSAITGVDQDGPTDHEAKYYDLTIDANSAAKVFAVAYVVQGLISRCFPTKSGRWYGWGDSDLVSYVITSYADTVLFTGIGAVSMLVYECSVCVAIGAMHIAYIISRGLLIFSPKYQQFRNATFYVFWAFTVVGAYAGIAETTWCTTFFKVLATLHALVAVQMVFFPSTETASKMLNLPPSSLYDDNFLALAKGTSLFYLGFEAFCLMVLYGEDVAFALGCASIFGLLHFFDALFLSKTARKRSISCVLYVLWLAFFTVMTPLCLGFGDNTSPTVKSQTE